jgi:SNARE protein
MDKNVIAEFEDYQSSIMESFKKIDKKLNSYNKLDKSKKKIASSFFKQELANIKSNIGMMKADLESFRETSNLNLWKENIAKLKHKLKEYIEKIKNLDKDKSNNMDYSNNNISNYKDPDEDANYIEMNVQQVMERGNNILDEDDKVISNMAKIVNEDVDQMKNANVELNRQIEVMDNVDDDLKDMEFSLKRAGKQIRNMFRVYSSDKCIMCLIIVILIIIITIIILSICGKDTNNNFFVPHDIFNTNNITTTNSGLFLLNTNYLLRIIIFIFFPFL